MIGREAAGRKPPLFVYCRHRGALHSKHCGASVGKLPGVDALKGQKTPLLCFSTRFGVSLSEWVSKLSVHWSQLRDKSVTHVHTTTANWSVDKLGRRLQDI